jgi:3-vinyl bacteriochlorophyllide hydratase
MQQRPGAGTSMTGLYTPEQRARRDASPWTTLQGLLAPLQFLVFAISLALILRFLISGHGQQAAAVSVLIKTIFLYTIMVTGAFWEKEVFGRYLFAAAFFWEDVVSMGVIALHTLYVALWFGHHASVETQFLIALLAYASYVLNAAQFLRKLALARRARPAQQALAGGVPA